MLTRILSLHGTWTFQPLGADTTHDITVPSHWSHGQCWGYPEDWAEVEQAWYSRQVTVPEAWRGCDVRLAFDAVMLKAEVFADDEKLGEHTGGFTPFAFDVSHLVGKTVTLRVLVSSARSVMPNPDVLTYPISYNNGREEGPVARGIWQNVRLEARPPVHIEDWTYVSSVQNSKLSCTVVVRNTTDQLFEGIAGATLASDERVDADPHFLASPRLSIAPGESQSVAMTRSMDGLPLWSHRDPVLLDVTLCLSDQAGAAAHTLPVKIGLREFRVQGGSFLLNETPVHLLGFSLVRSRVSPHIWRRDYLRLFFTEMKKLGFNAVRTHGCIAPPVVFEIADEVGILVESQSSLWSDAERMYWPGGETFMQNALQELTDWIARDRNHPSVVMWDMENEMIRINIRQQPNTRRFLERTRELDPSRLAMTSAAGVFEDADVYHVHAEQRLDLVVDGWRDTGCAKPFIAGEWWPDKSEFGVSCVVTHPGMTGTTRVPPDFTCEADINRRHGKLWGDAIREQRLKNISGSFPFVLEMFLFDPPFQGAQPVDVCATDDDPVGFTFAEDYHFHEWVSIRHPHVNPGWAPDRPACIINEDFAAPVRESLRPILVGFAECAGNVTAGTVQRTLAVVNDSEHTLDTVLSIQTDGIVLAEAPIRIEPGGFMETPVELEIPNSCIGQRIEIEAFKVGDATAMPMTSWNVFAPPVSSGAEVWLSGVDPAIATALQSGGVVCNDWTSATPPASPGPWIVGSVPNLDRDAVMTWLESGGTLLVLRQESIPEWLPAIVSFESSIGIMPEVLWGFGFNEPLSRAKSGVRLVPILAPGHAVFAGLPNARRIGPWADNDGRVIDDVYLKDEHSLSDCITVLAGGRTTDAISLGEMPVARGRILLCQWRLVENVATDPEATALLQNLVAHAAAPPVRDAQDFMLLTDTQECLSFLKNLDANGDARVEAGLNVLCLLDGADSPWPASALDENSVFSIVERPKPLLGVTHDDIRRLMASPETTHAMQVEPEGSDWRDAILAFANRCVSEKAGMSLDALQGSLFKYRQFGKGSVAVATAALPMPGVLSRYGVTQSADSLHVFHDRAKADVVRSAAFSPTGNYWNWACLETDKNLKQGSRAVPLVLRPKAEPCNYAAAGNCAGLGYLMWNETHLYAAIVSTAPRHSFGTGPVAYDNSCMELFIGPTQIVLSLDADGNPVYYVHGIRLHGAGTDAIDHCVTLLDHMPDWPDLALLPTAGKPGLTTCMFEMAIPWDILEAGHPSANDTLQIALGLGFADSDYPGHTVCQHIAPTGFQHSKPATYMTARFTP